MEKMTFSSILQNTVLIGHSSSFMLSCLKKISAEKTIFISDEIIWRNCNSFFPKDFLRKFDKVLLLKNPKADDKNLKIIAKNLQNIENILCLGSGTINDLCKYSAAEKNISYSIFASAASMNGYLSKNASITIKGHKKTLPATLPNQVFCNLDILKAAPLELTKAGIGDSLCFYSCWFDWFLSHKILGTKFDQKPFEILQPKMDFLVKNYQKFSLKDDKFLALLIEILLLSGIGMTMAGGSYPASQSEHMIAHTIDMKYPKKFAKLLHGQVIAVTSLTAAFLQEVVLEVGEFTIDKTSYSGVQRFFKTEVAQACIKEYEEKIKLMKKVKKLSKKDLSDLKKIHLPAKKLREIAQHFKIKITPKSLGFSKDEYDDCVTMAKFTRNRFTCLDLVVQDVA